MSMVSSSTYFYILYQYIILYIQVFYIQISYSMQNIIQSKKYRSIKVQHLPILEKTSNFAIVRTTIMLNQRQTIDILTAGSSDTALLTYVNQCSQYLTAYKIVSASVTAGLILITQINEIDVYFIEQSWSFKTCLLSRQVLTTP